MKKLLSLIILAIFLLQTPVAFAASPSLVQSAQVYTGATASKAFPSNITNGNLLIVAIQDSGSGSVKVGDPSVSDGKHLWTQLIGNNWVTTSKQNQWIFYAVATSSGADTVTVTRGASGADMGFHISEWSGQAASPFGNTTSTSTTVASANWVTFPFSVPDNATVVALAGEENTSTGSLTPRNGFASTTQNVSQYSMVMSQQFATASSSATVNATFASSQNYAIEGFVILGTADNRFTIWGQTFINGQMFIN